MIALFQDDASKLSPFFFDSILYRKKVKARHEHGHVETAASATRSHCTCSTKPLGYAFTGRPMAAVPT
jgi:hypothetical protein